MSTSASPFYYRTGTKITAAVLFCVFLLLALAGGIGVYFMGERGFYTESFESVEQQLYTGIGRTAAQTALSKIYTFRESTDTFTAVELESYERTLTVDRLRSLTTDSDVLLTYHDATGNIIVTTYNGLVLQYEGEVALPVTLKDGTQVERIMRFHIPLHKTDGGQLSQYDRWLGTLYSLRWWTAVLFALSVIITACLLILLTVAAGHHVDETEPRPSFFDAWPTDLTLVLYALLAWVWAILLEDIKLNAHPLTMLFGGMLLIPTLPLVLLLCMSIATRCKCHTLLHNTIIRRLFSPVARLISRIPLIPKVAFSIAAVLLLELVAIILWCESLWFLLFWLIESLILSLAVLYLTLSMRKLQRGAQALAEGDLNHQIDEGELRGEFRQHAHHLNRVSESMEREVEERMKSERFRTELITNVSHDIKTPLTSIISYINLLKGRPQSDETARDYILTIERQSVRLKKLMEDLIEVSKATTGNLAIELAPCELDVMLSQALGEYQERMRAADLLPVLHVGDVSPVIMADGKLLWRVFDNLLSNALKYSMPGTRIYLDLRAENGEAILLFRNVSREELNVSAEELLERFVRGDRSRHSEGSGLGLPIASSLVERMGGSLSLEVDADLFKITLRFALYEPEPEPAPEPEAASEQPQ